MKKLLTNLQRQLRHLRRSGRAFAQKHPHLGSALGLGDEVQADPQIEHLIQSIAMLNARTEGLVDDRYYRFTAGLLAMVSPQVLRPIPSFSIAQIDATGPNQRRLLQETTIPRGTQMHSLGGVGMPCKFTTAYDVHLVPVRLAGVRFESTLPADAGIHLRNVSARICIDIESTSATLALGQSGAKSLRTFINADASLSAALRDTLLSKVVRAYVEVDSNGMLIPLEELPIKSVGFNEGDAVLPFNACEHPAYRLLIEYFFYPDKFNFVDIDLGTILATCPAPEKRLTLHLAIVDVRSDSAVSRLLRALTAENLLLGCTPILNLFKQAAKPITLTQTRTTYPLLPSATPPAHFDIYRVDSVHLLRNSPQSNQITEFAPLYTVRHSDQPGRRSHFVLYRDDELAELNPGHEHCVALVDREFNPLNIETGTISSMLTCTNRDLPSVLPYGAPSGDLGSVGDTLGFPIRLLRRPTRSHRLTTERGAHYQLISHLSLNHRALTPDGREAFAAMLSLYSRPGCQVAQRQLEAVTGIEHRTTSLWMRNRQGKAYVAGIEMRVTLDEEAFTESGLHVFIELLDHFFGLYVHLNSFTQLVVQSNTSGRELIRCLPRNGALNLV